MQSSRPGCTRPCGVLDIMVATIADQTKGVIMGGCGARSVKGLWLPAAILGLALGLGLPAPALATQDSYGTDSLAYMRGGTPVCWMSASEKGVELLYDADPNITGDETTYTLVMDGLTRIEEHQIVFHTVLDRDGRDISRQFTSITLLEVPGGIVLSPHALRLALSIPPTPVNGQLA